MRDALITVVLARAAAGEPLSLKAVVEAAGTSTQSIYTVFGGRQGLMDAAREVLQDRVDDATDQGTQAAEVGSAWLQWCEANKGWARMLYATGSNPTPPQALLRCCNGAEGLGVWGLLRGLWVLREEGECTSDEALRALLSLVHPAQR